jgi:glycosyltransferase involved in cell wall biosynthesis
LKLLSICIPTYKRPTCLAELLDSIAHQVTDEIEIVISDDASGDQTEAVVSAYKERLPSLKYFLQAENIGLDENFRKLADYASGTYIWFMGDDDKLEPEAVKTVIKALGDWPDITGLTIGVIDYDPKFNSPTGLRRMPPTQVLHGTRSVFTSIIDLLGFMSALVIRRDLWQTVCQTEPIDRYKNLYLQVYVIGRAIEIAGSWGILNAACVGFRTSNDQFLSKFGWLDRMKIDIDAYNKIAEGVFPNDVQTQEEIKRKVFKSHIMSRIRNAKTGAAATPDLLRAIRLLFREYKKESAFWYSTLPTLLAPNWLMRNLKRLYQTYSPTSGARRAKVTLTTT